jgi:glycosyltransferase involved in cell wall biosynthesis
MKILYVNSFYRPHIGGGAEVTLENIVEGMARRGHEVVVFSTSDKPGISIETVGSAKVYRAEIKNVFWHYPRNLPPKFVRALWHWYDRNNPRMGSVVRDVIRAEKPDIISFHNLAGISIAAWQAAFDESVPAIQVLHDLYLMCPPTTTFKNNKACETRCLECRYFRREHPAASSQLSAVVGVSRYILDRLTGEGYFKHIRQEVIHNTKTIPDATGPRKAAVRERVTFGYIGALNPPKGIEWLIEQFRARGHGAKLLIAGEGSEQFKAKLRMLCGNSDVEFLGYVNSSTFYSQIDVAVVPSIWPDTFPGVAYEACAHHVPVIASGVGGLPEIISDGVNGVLCDPKNESSLGDAIEKILADRAMRETLSRNARASVEELLEPDRMITAYEALYSAIRH